MPFKPKFTISTDIASALTAIERTRGFLEAASLSQDWIEKMQARALLLEAHHTTHIEGTHLSLDESERLIAGEDLPFVNSDDAKELLNYKDAFAFVADYVASSGPITEGLIREIHKHLVQNVRGNSAEPGLYRTVQNYVANGQTKEIIYTPPEPFDVPLLMQEFVDWLRCDETQKLPAVIVAGIAQFQLVHIHPFLDGNGRTSRLLSTLCLYKAGYDFRKLFTISEYYDRNRPDYYNALQSAQKNDLDLTSWLEYFSSALVSQMKEIQHKGALAMKLDVLALQNKLNSRQKQALDSIAVADGAFTIKDYEDLYPNVNRRTLQRDLADLVAKEMIVMEGDKKAAQYRLKKP